LGYPVIYIDTDACYCHLKKEEFYDIEQRFKNGEIDIKELIKLKINRTTEHLIIVNKKVNEHLIKYTKYKYLNMSYEEVLYLSMWISKKMYLGIEHIGVVNELDIDRHLFLRGVSLVRRSCTNLTKNVIKDNLIRELFSYETMAKAHLDDNFSIEDIVKKHIYQVYKNLTTNQYPLEYFIKNDKYSPNKQNIKVNTFVGNLKNFIETLPTDELKLKYAIPEPADRFSYILINKPEFNSTTSIGDMMQYPFYIEDFNGELHTKKYFESELSNEFSSFICEDKKGKRYCIKLFEMLSNGYDFEELSKYSIDELLETKDTIKKGKQKERLLENKQKKNHILDIIYELFPNNKLMEIFGYFINDKNIVFKNIDKKISKISLWNIHYFQSSLYEKYHGNKYKEPKLNTLFDKLNEEKNKNKKLIELFLIKNYDDINKIILDLVHKKETILDYNFNIELEIIDNLLIDKEIIENYMDKVYKIHKILEYKNYLKYIKTK
jgi:hypothetical protein